LNQTLDLIHSQQITLIPSSTVLFISHQQVQQLAQLTQLQVAVSSFLSLLDMHKMLSLFIFRTRSQKIKLVRDTPLPARGEDGVMILSPDLEDRWNAALIRAPSRCGVTEMNLPEELEQRWNEAWIRAPMSVEHLPTYFARLLPEASHNRNLSAPA
jgi:hypothetical protein